MSTVLTNIRDNHTHGTVADFLRATIQDNSHLSVVSAYFTICEYDALKESLDRIFHLDFLFGETITEEDCLPRLRTLFETLYDGTRPLRIALDKLQTFDTVQIIEGKV